MANIFQSYSEIFSRFSITSVFPVFQPTLIRARPIGAPLTLKTCDVYARLVLLLLLAQQARAIRVRAPVFNARASVECEAGQKPNSYSTYGKSIDFPSIYFSNLSLSPSSLSV